MAITNSEGSATFPTTYNDVYELIETLAVQNIDSLKSTNRIIDGVHEYPIENGKVIEEAVIEMAEAQAFDKSELPTFAPHDPVVHGRYFNNFVPKQFMTTIRRDDIRAILANKGETVEGVVSKILDTLTQGDGSYDFEQTRNAIFSADFVNYARISGAAPATIKGVMYMLRDMYRHVLSDNSDLTAIEYKSSVPDADIRIALTPKLLNLIDIVELANVFNLSKEELFGKLVVIDVDDLSAEDNMLQYYRAYVYDVKAIGRATRVYDFTQDVIGEKRYTNEILTVERAYFHNGLFKGAYIDCIDAAQTALSDITTSVTPDDITETLTGVTAELTLTDVAPYERVYNVYNVDSGYVIDEDSTITLKEGSYTFSEGYTVSEDGKTVTVDFIHSAGAVTITITATEEE